MSDRKYRQHGYQDGAGKNDRAGITGQQSPKQETYGPRTIQLAGTHSISRCGQCGALLPSTGVVLEQCGKCGFELHSCKQCTYFDPSARFECTQNIPERISRKDQRNLCDFYSISVRFEKQTSTPALARPADARQAFENLFKK